jgi:protein O-GlcNAcase/histone acetyltransferase
MPDEAESRFLAGVVEGFYGPPWSPSERRELLEWMTAWKLNTYLYAPKDDLKHRALWRELYTPAEAEMLGQMIRACGERGVRFIYALSPGLDIRYSRLDELRCVLTRFEQLHALGCRDFALLFDDIPDRMHDEDRQRWGSFASAQCQLANAALRQVRERERASRFLFCPTPYCERMATRHLGGAGYLETVGRELEPEIDVLWTGPEIISREISVEHIRDVGGLLRRRPMIWDNLHANDYDGRRFFCGPYSGRAERLSREVSGILCNPNSEFPLNFVPLHTFAAYLRCEGTWDARAAYETALTEWLPRFESVRGPAALEELRLLGDCFYLPHEEGPEAEKIYDQVWQLLTRPSREWNGIDAAFTRDATRLRDFCGRLADLRDRELFRAVHRRIWELREELDLLLGYVRLKRENPAAAIHSDYHLPGTYRGGLVARLQQLLGFRPDGTFVPAFVETPASPNSGPMS